MTPDGALDPLDQSNIQARSTAGMTTKVVKGSIWTLTGSVLPLAVSFISTPFIIRFLGAESYGVLLLVGLIPSYFGFADFGMGVASTKFASEAFGEGNAPKENKFVWTAATIAAVCSIVVAIPMFLFSRDIVAVLNVPEHLIPEASIALKITSIGFVLGVLASVVNSPMLARLRMDLNTVTTAVPRILLAVLTPIVLYFGAGIVGAVTLSFVIAIASIVAVVYFSWRMLATAFRPTFAPDVLRPLLKFGRGWVLAMFAGMLLMNLEKLFLTKMVSVEALAYYSVAYTFATMVTLFSNAMIQSLVPAFARLQSPEKESEYRTLFGRAIRLNLLWLLPALMIMLVVARPFFTLWAGEEFGRQSTLPFCILVFGLFCNVLAYVPHATITAAGQTHLFAKLYWIELVIYAVLAYVLIAYFGIVGAAIAWTVRGVLDGILIMWLSKRITRFPFSAVSSARYLGLVSIIALPIVFGATIYSEFSVLLIPPVIIFILLYAVIAWRKGIEDAEREWLKERIAAVRGYRLS